MSSAMVLSCLAHSFVKARVTTTTADPCTGARGRRLPTGPSSWPTDRGTCAPQVLKAQGAKGGSRKVDPCRQAYQNEELTDGLKGTGEGASARPGLTR